MPGYPVDDATFKNKDDFNRYRCPKCDSLLREAVQLSCGDRLCKSCADEVIARHSPLCPQAHCGEPLDNEGGAYYFPDRFVRREINNLEVICPFAKDGCNWEGKYGEYCNHISTCGFRPIETPDIRVFATNVSPSQSLDLSEAKSFEPVQLCSESLQCPLSAFGCIERFMDKDQLNQHLQENQCGHLTMIVNRIQLVEESLQASHVPLSSNMNDQSRHQDPLSPQQIGSEIAALKFQTRNLERQIHSRNADLNCKDHDFWLSLIENSNHDGTMIWKIPQFSQRKADAVNGKYTSIYSPPFYTGRYGYKMCLRLYIMGDGIGKGTHLSLFFVVMRGEFDNILQWPFIHKVTFKLINQAGGSDIIDTFKPDPMSNSFRKPISDMNIASGCPRFVSHTELEQSGFIVDDTIFIKCIVDTTTIFHP